MTNPDKVQNAAWLPAQVGLTISAEGDLNPRIFHPQWFAKVNLLRDNEALKANVELSAADYSLFNTKDFSCEVSQDSLTLTTRNQAFEPSLHELFGNIFDLLPHTPLRSVQVSRYSYWRPNPADPSMSDEYDWSELLNMKPWADILDVPAPRGIAINGSLGDGITTTVAVEPPLAEEDVDAVISIGCRYHWTITEVAGKFTSRTAIDLLNAHWSETKRHAEVTTRKLLDFGRGQRDAE